MRIKPSLLLAIAIISTALILLTLNFADKIDSKPIVEQEQIITVQATAFNEYGTDSKGIAYGPGYVIVSSHGQIPLNALLDIDIYGECQAVAVSDKLASDEIMLWYNAPSKVKMFGEQTAYARIIGKGDRPHKTE